VVCADASLEVDEPDDLYEDLQFWDGELPVRARVFTAGSVALDAFVRAAAIQDGLEECAAEGLKDALKDGEVEVGCALPGPRVVLPAAGPYKSKEGMHMKPLHAPLVKRGRVYSFGGVEGWPEEVPQSVREDVAARMAESTDQSGKANEDVPVDGTEQSDKANEDVSVEGTEQSGANEDVSVEGTEQSGANEDVSATESFDCQMAKLKFEGTLAKRTGESLQDVVAPSARVA
jgi:hypothetical protein